MDTPKRPRREGDYPERPPTPLVADVPAPLVQIPDPDEP